MRRIDNGENAMDIIIIIVIGIARGDVCTRRGRWRGLRGILWSRPNDIRRSWCLWDGGNDDRPSIVAEACQQRFVCGQVQFGIAIVLGVTSMGDDLVVKRNRLASRGDNRVASKDHAQLAGFGGDSRVYGSAEIDRQTRGGGAGVELETDLDADIANK